LVTTYEIFLNKSNTFNCRYMTAEEALQSYYKSSGDSQPVLAARFGVSQTAVHNWLSNKNRIPMEFYPRVSEICGVNLTEILPEDWKEMIYNLNKSVFQ
jgi:transcriptional regulator with XRE-family HTH domain